jgi:hypothetical protein
VPARLCIGSDEGTTKPYVIPCGMGYRAGWDTVPDGILCRMGEQVFDREAKRLLWCAATQVRHGLLRAVCMARPLRLLRLALCERKRPALDRLDEARQACGCRTLRCARTVGGPRSSTPNHPNRHRRHVRTVCRLSTRTARAGQVRSTPTLAPTYSKGCFRSSQPRGTPYALHRNVPSAYAAAERLPLEATAGLPQATSAVWLCLQALESFSANNPHLMSGVFKTRGD